MNDEIIRTGLELIVNYINSDSFDRLLAKGMLKELNTLIQPTQLPKSRKYPAVWDIDELWQNFYADSLRVMVLITRCEGNVDANMKQFVIKHAERHGYTKEFVLDMFSKNVQA